MAQISAEKLEHTEPAEKERVASVPQREQSKAPDRKVRERVSVSENHTLARERGIRAGTWRRKSGLLSEGKGVSRK